MEVFWQQQALQAFILRHEICAMEALSQVRPALVHDAEKHRLLVSWHGQRQPWLTGVERFWLDAEGFSLDWQVRPGYRYTLKLTWPDVCGQKDDAHVVA